ncbi:MAG: glycoside hydrolase family 18 protein [bacterium]|nr:glycoside hydrolase family 18 protein [bacterium]
MRLRGRETRVVACPARPRVGDYLVYGYYPYWASSTSPPAMIAFEELTHVSHAFVWPRPDGSLHIPRLFNPTSLVQEAHAKKCKALLCVGGGGENSASFRHVTSNDALRAMLVRAVRGLVVTHRYDGVEINWEFPRDAEDGTNLVRLVHELRDCLGTAALISVTVNGSHHGSQHIDVRALCQVVDLFPVMTYDYHGSWSAVSGHNAPLLAYGGAEGDVSSGMAYWLARGLPRAKILLGLAFYGRSFDAVDVGHKFTRSRAHTYSEIALLRGNGYVRRWDATAQVPYLLSEEKATLISYDDLLSLSKKIDYVKSEQFGGVMIWHVAGDIHRGRHWLLHGVGACVRGARLLAGALPQVAPDTSQERMILSQQPREK